MIGQPHERRPLAGIALIIVLLLGRAAVADEPPVLETTAGRLLVASPDMPDARFAQSVIYMVAHDATGAMGVIVNRPLGDVPMADLLDALGMADAAADGRIGVHYGGPVENELGFVLHTTDGDENPDSRSLGVAGGFALSMNGALLRAIAAGAGPRRILVLFGYAGWGPGQLDSELQRHDWQVVPADEDLVFGADHDAKWQRAMDRRGVDL